IPASYVNWVGQAGARALPVLLGEAPEYYDKIFQVSNGLLFPGGNQGISPGAVYTDEGAQLYTLALAANDAGDDYPIWGTCLGFEELAVLAAPPDANVVSEDVKATNVALPLDYAAGANESRLLASFPPDLVSALAKENVTFNSHDHGVLLSTFEATPDLASFFAVISTNHLAKSGAEFVSTMEAFDYPFYGTQWHPEKANFEWSLGPDYSNIPHSPTAVEASQATANFFVEAARGSSHVF
ncbi:peptidase C26, partial [Pelagophyceae sp. CCMP2097]